MSKAHFQTFLLRSKVDASWSGPDSSPSQKKQTSFDAGWCCVLWRVNFFLAGNLSKLVACRFSARCSLVLLNFLLHDGCHLAWCSSIVASMPLPASRRLRSIGMGISCSLLKHLIFLAKLEYPWPRMTSCLLDCAGHWSSSGVVSWQRKQIDQSVLVGVSVSFDKFEGPGWVGSTMWKVLDIALLSQAVTYSMKSSSWTSGKKTEHMRLL